ncbi:putative membrane protein [Burkholderia thailandensis USAMRU Malaysia |nr:hypothetical protein BTH_I1369 [Burkholderia thailandensis E264]AHI63907.1 putative membrane protein [Burkholderia thailandensis H0587]AHI73785.1 putative membrane protein [Burkholderia thailandensis 2002721723]AHI79264.1 putative membrane protein [Burkholderia thailandensis E444]AIC85844.1 putative membrane protein [Burkholderia thailandensis USAMRU Malaysia \
MNRFVSAGIALIEGGLIALALAVAVYVIRWATFAVEAM